MIAGDQPGVVIARIVSNSAAGEAGLRSGDVILQVNGQNVEAAPEVTRIIRATPAGETITLRVRRNGQEQDIPATLRPAGEQYRTNFRGGASPGMSGDLEARTRQLESQLAMVIQELQRLRQEVSQLRAGQPEASGGAGGIRVPPQDAIPPVTTPSDLDATDQNRPLPGLDTTPGPETPGDTDTGLPF
jgi:membrane-associated protease RseP (regulator of RpoE activity)